MSFSYPPPAAHYVQIQPRFNANDSPSALSRPASNSTTPPPPLASTSHLDHQQPEELLPMVAVNPGHGGPRAGGKKKGKVVSPPPGTIVLDKSCVRCRVRKVKCDRIAPVCTNCIERNEEDSCDLGTLAKRPKGGLLSPEASKILRLEKRLAEMEQQVKEATIGHTSIDWRLATPTMVASLSEHLVAAFFDSCCSFLPAFKYFRHRLLQYHGKLDQLDTSSKVAIAAYCAIGARASPHSAILGIANTQGESLLNVGIRRQSACQVLSSQAHTMSFDCGLGDKPTMANLGGIMALLQMSIFVELEPSRSRSLVRVALGHFKDLQEDAGSEQERMEIKQAFALPLYSTDAITAAYARQSCLVTDDDLRRYFDRVEIVVPRLPGTELIVVLEEVLGGGMMNRERGLETAVHVLNCWTIACQRMFATRLSAPVKSVADYKTSILQLWIAIDQARGAIQLVQSAISSSQTPHSHSHSHSSSSGSFHEIDHLSKIIRFDRDLLDLFTLVDKFLIGYRVAGIDELRAESKSRVRRALKVLAFYAKVYICSADVHMIFHHAFQMQLNPDWTSMALQRVGERGGPRDTTEEVSIVELGWFIEGLEHACYYMPGAEAKLKELSVGYDRLMNGNNAFQSPPPYEPHDPFVPSSLSHLPPLQHNSSNDFLPLNLSLPQLRYDEQVDVGYEGEFNGGYGAGREDWQSSGVYEA